jgi:tripartite ATP-independent transporter DctP family solute receptor
MKKILAAALLLAMMLALAACGSNTTTTTTTTTTTAASEEKAVTLKLAHNLAEDHAVNIAMTAWAEAVNEASNGSITIEIYPNGTLGSESDCVSQLQAGGLEMTKVSAGTLGNFKNEWNAVSVPYVFNDKEHYYNVMDGEIAEDLYALTEDDGFIGLTWLDSGSRSFYTADTPIRTPSDLKGLKIRTMDSQMAIDMMTALGGSATVMSYSDIYTGMQNHVVDGAENNITAMRDHADVTKYYCFDEHTRIPDIVVISTKAWNSLSENQQNILKSTAVDMTENYKTLWAEFEDEVRQQAEEAGVEFITDVDTAAFQEACQSIYENLKTSDPDTYAFVERIQAVA